MKIQVILGSVRQGRFGIQPAQWIVQKLTEQGIEAELLDLKEYPLPFFEEAASPSSAKEPFTNPGVLSWQKKIAEGDGYIFVVAEYNHGYTAVLKNALDYVYKEWNNKPVSFVSYGGVSAGTRAVQQLRQVCLELQLIPLRNGVHLSLYWEKLVDGKFDFSSYEQAAQGLIKQLTFWTEKLKTIREELATQ